jgi:hypothetical protein
MSNIIPFESGKVPAYLKSLNVADLNSDLTSHAGTGFPIISIKGKVFAVVRDGERTTLTKTVDGEEIPAPSIDVVIVKANKQNSKVFYLKGYQDGAENQKPDCMSSNGTHPDASIEKPQAKSCAVCPHNQWGSKIGDGGGKGKACSDSVRLAVAQPDLLNDPYLLRVPPATIKALGEYGKALAKRGVPYTAVVTKIGFDMESPTPKLTFRATGFLSDEAYAEAQETAASDVVAAILGSEGAMAAAPEPDATADLTGTPPKAAVAAKPAAPKAAAPSKSKTVTNEEVDAAVAAVTSKAVSAASKPDASIDVDVGLNLDDLNFDD